VLREANGALSIVSSDYQPDHAKWPGKIKGGPVPSLEYRRSQWDLHIEQKRAYVRVYTRMLKALKDTPLAHAEESWQHAKERDPESLRGFAGPKDERYRVELRTDYETSLREVQAELQELQEQRP
jgi:hypothetical protein